MPIDPSLSLQIASPNPTNMISGFLDLGQKQIQLDKSRQTFDADVARSKADSQTAQATANVATQTQAPRIAQAGSEASTAAAGASDAWLKTARAHFDNTAQAIQPLATDPDLTWPKLKKGIDTFLDASNAPPQAYAMMYGGAPQPTGNATNDTASLQKYAVNLLQRAQTAQQMLESRYPSPQLVNDGQTVQPRATGNAALTGVQPGTAVGVPAQVQVPPTAPTMSAGGQPTYVGPQPGQRPGMPAIPSGPALGQQEATTGPIAINTQHLTSVQQAAADAPTRIGVLQNIKSLSHEAATGSADTYKAVIAKLAGYTGWAGDKQTATDVMAKEAALLASKGGQTDLARTLNEAATPGGHMTEGAIRATSDQLIGQEKAKLAAQDYFGGTPTNSPLYGQKMAAWAKNGDPQAFEYASKSPADQAAMKAAMQKAGTWSALRAHMIQLHAMGIDPE